MKKIRVGILFGGRSGEHEVSLLSAASIMEAMDKSKYEVIPIGITTEGRWVTAGDAHNLLRGEHGAGRNLRAGDPQATTAAAVLASGDGIIVPPVPAAGDLAPFESESGAFDSRKSGPQPVQVDIIFPALHGTFGEDGTIQGLLELADIAYVGAGVLGSAASMDKDVMKRLFQQAGLPIVKHLAILRSEWERDAKGIRREIERRLKYPLFVKPANLGSSVGISKVHNARELGPAMAEAARYDRKIIVEQGIGSVRGKAREFECSVLGNDQPQASLPGEIIPGKEFYDYAAKYLDEGSISVIPAKLAAAQVKKIQQMAIAAFQATDCSGLARVDFLMEPRSKRLFVNEINTMPGFTKISQYPKLWAASGLPYPKLIDRLIELGLERHEDKKKTRFTREQ